MCGDIKAKERNRLSAAKLEKAAVIKLGILAQHAKVGQRRKRLKRSYGQGSSTLKPVWQTLRWKKRPQTRLMLVENIQSVQTRHPNMLQ
jgi:hypothetical protein